MQRVIVAIILRETKTRFGKNMLGYLWAFIEPAAYIAILLFIRNQMHASVPFGENLYLFILTGILVYRIFISISGRATSSITANQALLTYPLVKPIDAIFARILLESLTMLVILIIFFTLLTIFSDGRIIHYPHVFFQAIVSVMLLAAGVGSLNAVLSILYPAWERLWNLIKFPILFLSGVFYIPKAMPPVVQDIIVWNPVLHCVEWFRYATYLDYDPMLSQSYVIWFSLSTLMVSLVLERVYRNSLVSS